MWWAYTWEGGLIHGGGTFIHVGGLYSGGLIVEGLRYLFNIYFIVTIMQWANVVIKHI